MARKNKPKRFQAVNAVKALARERLGSPPPARVTPDQKKKRQKLQEKHKLTLERLLEEDR